MFILDEDDYQAYLEDLDADREDRLADEEDRLADVDDYDADFDNSAPSNRLMFILIVIGSIVLGLTYLFY